MDCRNLNIDEVELDFENPRIAHYLSVYKTVTSEELSLALSGSTGSDATSKYKALRNSIENNRGIFTPIIVNHKTETDEYIVIEGNTRLKFYKEFREKEPEGPWNYIPAIVYEDMEDDEIHAIRLQAHMVGARDWDPFSKAKYLNYLYNVEQKPMSYLKDFCGGQPNTILNLIEAYNDMVKYYVPACEEEGDEPDTQVFSYFVELQKSGAKDAIFAHGYDLKDFTKWVINENLDRAEGVRKIARVLGEEPARNAFLKGNMTEAIKKLDMQESEMKKIAKSNLYDLAKEVTMKLRNITSKEMDMLIENPKYASKKEILQDLGYELEYIIEKLGD